MILNIASHKAVKYACLNFHYAKAIPVTKIAFNVFNNKKEWCGCITFGGGANYRLGSSYGLVNGQFLELTRMALNGKQESTSKAMSIAIKLIKKNYPLVKLLFSYADKGQNHTGIIYQATNWLFVDETETSGWEIFYKGKWRHDRILANVSKKTRNKIPKRKKSGKYKYLYPLDNILKKDIIKLKKPYPKNAAEV
jgi:hypothetical protein